jgi:hypothetical protein
LVPRGPKKYQGWSVLFSRFFIVFLNSPHRETPKNVIKKNREKIGFGFFWSIFLKNFSTRFFCKTFFVVLLNSPHQETPKNAIKTKKVEEKLISKNLSVFWEFSRKKFSTWTFYKNIFMVFLNSPYRETPKNVLKKNPKNNILGLVGSSRVNQIYVKVRHFFF